MTDQKITVLVLDNVVETQLQRTMDSLSAQTDGEYSLRVLSLEDFRNLMQGRIEVEGDYALFVYSGTVLVPEAVERISESLRRQSAEWYYFDESITPLRIAGVPYYRQEKPEFDPMQLALHPMENEAVLFSTALLRELRPCYRGSSFAVALMELTSAAACRTPGVHVPEVLLKRKERTIDPAEANEALLVWSDELLTKCGVTSGYLPAEKHPGVTLYPEPLQDESISIVALLRPSDGLPEWIEELKNRFEVLETVWDRSYAEACLRGIRAAGGTYVCVLDARTTYSDAKMLEHLTRYASIPIAGMVSPCLLGDGKVRYAGAFSVAGHFEPIDAEDTELLPSLQEVRETAMPAWQLWALRREDALSLRPTEMPSEAAILEWGAQLREQGLHNLYVGNLRAFASEADGGKDAGFADLICRCGAKYHLDAFCPTDLKLRMQAELKGVKGYFPDKRREDPSKRRVFVLTHELSLTGAPIVLVHAVRILQDAGWQAVVVSPVDGHLKQEFLSLGVPVLVWGDLDRHTWWLRYAVQFDLVLVNTVVPFRQIEQLRDLPVPVLWWLHDARSGYEEYLRHVLPETVGKNVRIRSVSAYADRAARDFRPNYRTGLLMYGLKDEASALPEIAPGAPEDKAVFLCVGTVLARKGQDILAQAIRLLPENVRVKCRFCFIGKQADEEIYGEMERVRDEFPEQVELVDSVPHAEVFQLFRAARSVICASRDDPLPTFMAETMMVSGVCICSENTGIAPLIRHGKNGYVYANNDPAALAKCICEAAECRDQTAMRRASRKLFEEYFTMDRFRANLLESVEECLNGSEVSH